MLAKLIENLNCEKAGCLDLTLPDYLGEAVKLQLNGVVESTADAIGTYLFHQLKGVVESTADVVGAYLLRMPKFPSYCEYAEASEVLAHLIKAVHNDSQAPVILDIGCLEECPEIIYQVAGLNGFIPMGKPRNLDSFNGSIRLFKPKKRCPSLKLHGNTLRDEYLEKNVRDYFDDLNKVIENPNCSPIVFVAFYPKYPPAVIWAGIPHNGPKVLFQLNEPGSILDTQPSLLREMALSVSRERTNYKYAEPYRGELQTASV